MQIDRYFSSIKGILEDIQKNQMGSMETVSNLFTETIANCKLRWR